MINKKFSSLATGRDISNLEQQLLRETNAVINSLNAESDSDVDYQRQQLAKWLFKWDQEYKFNATEYYPEYADFFTSIGYGKI